MKVFAYTKNVHKKKHCVNVERLVLLFKNKRFSQFFAIIEDAFMQMCFYKGGIMNFSQEILMVLLISVIAQSTGTELATNSNFLLLLLLSLSGRNQCIPCGCPPDPCNPCCCPTFF